MHFFMDQPEDKNDRINLDRMTLDAPLRAETAGILKRPEECLIASIEAVEDQMHEPAGGNDIEYFRPFHAVA